MKSFVRNVENGKREGEIIDNFHNFVVDNGTAPFHMNLAYKSHSCSKKGLNPTDMRSFLSTPVPNDTNVVDRKPDITSHRTGKFFLHLCKKKKRVFMIKLFINHKITSVIHVRTCSMEIFPCCVMYFYIFPRLFYTFNTKSIKYKWWKWQRKLFKKNCM